MSDTPETTALDPDSPESPDPAPAVGDASRSGGDIDPIEPSERRNLTGKVALVTGSSSGIGAECASQLADLGATVVVNSRSSVDQGKLVAEALGGSYIQGDISDARSAQSLVDGTLLLHNRLDILVNNAGTTEVIAHHDFEGSTEDVWRKILDVNVIGTWLLTRAAMPHLKATGDGSVINITSIAGIRQTGSSIPYGVSKAALNHLTEMLAAVSGPEVRVNAVAPGLVETPWTEPWGEGVFNAIAAGAPLKAWSQPEDIAEVVVDLVCARMVTGQIITVDGGATLKA